MSDAAFPFRIDARGRTAESGRDRHIRELIEQVIFTSPGERVNRPDLGSGILQLVFAGSDPTLAAALETALHATLDQWLGELIEVSTVEVRAIDSTLTVDIAYLLRDTGEARVASFTRAAG